MIRIRRFIGNKDYREIHILMKQNIDEIARKKLPGEIWFLEFLPIYTAGNRVNAREIKNSTINEVPLIFADRGGLITWHGPGQRIIYPLINLREIFSNSLETFLNSFYDAIINGLRSCGIKTYRSKEYPGLWTKHPSDAKKNDKKIASVGFKVKNGVLHHGIAINVCNSTNAFRSIAPCGIVGDDVMISMSEYLGDVVNLDDIDTAVINEIAGFMTIDGASHFT